MKSKKAFFISWLVSIVFCTIAITLLLIGYTTYGISMFCIFPILLGVSTGIIPDKKGAILGLSIGVISFFVILLASGLEGVICLIMATPILSVLIFLGFLVSYFIKRSPKKQSKVQISLIPILLFIGSSGIENLMSEPPVKQEITNSILLPYDNFQVYNAIIDVDTVSATPGTLHQLGLPLPLNCKLSQEGIGGLRVCAFNEGSIVEEIKDYERGEFLKMDVIEFNLKGRPWLKFDEDVYTIEKTKEGSKISRTTSYYSMLQPRFYWKMMEAWTIDEQHELVFRNLLKDLNEN